MAIFKMALFVICVIHLSELFANAKDPTGCCFSTRKVKLESVSLDFVEDQELTIEYVNINDIIRYGGEIDANL